MGETSLRRCRAFAAKVSPSRNGHATFKTSTISLPCALYIMALERNARPLTRCLRCTRHDRTPSSIRTFRTTPNALQETTTTESSAEPAIPPPSPPSSTNKPYPSPLISHTKHAEALLRAAGKTPIGSRRRRAALQSSANIPFSQLPYQCFQEARKVLQDDRREKTEQIEKERGRIRRLEGIEQRTPREEERLRLMRQSVEKLKLLADVNDPLVKKRFEDGMGMSSCALSMSPYS